MVSESKVSHVGRVPHISYYTCTNIFSVVKVTILVLIEWSYIGHVTPNKFIIEFRTVNHILSTKSKLNLC